MANPSRADTLKAYEAEITSLATFVETLKADLEKRKTGSTEPNAELDCTVDVLGQTGVDIQRLYDALAAKASD